MTINTLTTFPTAPDRSDPSTFSDRADAHVAHLETFVDEMNTSVIPGINDAADVCDAALQVTNVTKWISGTIYAEGDAVYDPTDHLTYRRRVAGGGTTRPGLDTTNWRLITGQGTPDDGVVTPAKLSTGGPTWTDNASWRDLEIIKGGGRLRIRVWNTGNLNQIWSRNAADSAYVPMLYSALTHEFVAGSTTALSIDSSGIVTVNGLKSSSPARLIGYSAGSGGTVTQTTSKSTAVTINRPNGKIVMHNESLSPGAVAYFSVLNSLVTPESVPVVAPAPVPPMIVNLHEASVVCVESGRFIVAIRNVYSVALSYALPINFSIIGGATS